MRRAPQAVAVVHNETTTGVTSDVGRVRQTMDEHDHPALLLVDGVSSIGALDFRFDEWRVDMAVRRHASPAQLLSDAGSDARLQGPDRVLIGLLWRAQVTGSQKAMSLPTGLAVVCASDKASLRYTLR